MRYFCYISRRKIDELYGQLEPGGLDEIAEIETAERTVDGHAEAGLSVAGGLLPDRFTLAQAQRLYEALRGEEVDAANFRRDVRATGLVEETGRTLREGPGRPGRVFRRVA